MYNSFTSLTGVAYPLKETFTFYTEDGTRNGNKCANLNWSIVRIRRRTQVRWSIAHSTNWSDKARKKKNEESMALLQLQIPRCGT